MGRVSGKVAIVTGGARGIGEAIARLLVKEGAQVVITDINDGAAVANELGENALFVKQDVRLEQEWRTVVSTAEKAFGPVSVLVNNAGIGSPLGSDVELISEETYRRIIDINQIGTFMGMQQVLPSMKKAGGGSIINMSSVSGLVGRRNSLAYTASKFAVRGMTKVAAIEFGPYNVRVNSVHPGTISSPMLYTAEGALRPNPRKIVEDLPAGRVGDAGEIAYMVLMLASDEVRFATGAEFIVDGGMTCM